MSVVKKKLLVIGPLPPPFSGPEIGTKHLLESDALNNTYDIFHINTTLRKSNSERGKLDATMFSAYIKYMASLFKALIVFRPDHVLYCVMTATLKGWVRDSTTILLCRLSGRRVVTQFRGGHFRYFIDTLPSYQRAVIKALLGQCKIVLAQADRLQSQFTGLLPDYRIGTLYNSVPAEFYSAFENRQNVTDKEKEKVNILFVGHLSFAKGYCDLLKIMSEIIPSHSVQLTCIGGPLDVERNVFCNQATGEAVTFESPKEYFQNYIIDKGFEDSVIFLGDRLAGENKVKAFMDADIFILPSYSEGFSMAILEGMAAGLPVVATCVGAAPEIIDDEVSGFIVDPGDISAMQDRLVRLINDKDMRKRFGELARSKCGESFVGEAGPTALVEILEAG